MSPSVSPDAGVLREAAGWATGQQVALATVVRTTGSAPRPVGTMMAVAADGRVAGSLSGGCVEGSVCAIAEEVIASRRPQLHRFGYSDGDAFSTGLTCGGELEVLVEPIAAADLAALATAGAAEEVSGAVVVVAHPDPRLVGARWLVGDRPDARLGTGLAAAVEADAPALMQAGQTRELTYGEDGQRVDDDVRVLVTTWATAPRLIVFGAVDFAAALARLAPLTGYRVTVCDARPVFATRARFPGTEVVLDRPHRYLAAEAEAGRLDARTAVCVLTHDPKFDVPALEVALGLDLAYVGAMGSRRAHEDRMARLREAGVPAPRLARLHSPIGLDIGAATPEETALAIMAEIVLDRSRATGRPLSQTSGPIRPDLRALPETEAFRTA